LLSLHAKTSERFQPDFRTEILLDVRFEDITRLLSLSERQAIDKLIRCSRRVGAELTIA
jgi:hypothetical protein